MIVITVTTLILQFPYRYYAYRWQIQLLLDNYNSRSSFHSSISITGTFLVQRAVTRDEVLLH